jgi:hypothetical protein
MPPVSHNLVCSITGALRSIVCTTSPESVGNGNALSGMSSIIEVTAMFHVSVWQTAMFRMSLPVNIQSVIERIITRCHDT